MIFIDPIIITSLVGKHIVGIDFIKVYSITDGHFQTLNSLTRSQHSANGNLLQYIRCTCLLFDVHVTVHRNVHSLKYNTQDSKLYNIMWK